MTYATPHPISWIVFILDSATMVGIPMSTNCAPVVTDLVFTAAKEISDSLNYDNQVDNIEAFDSTSRYLDDLLNIDSIDSMMATT